MKVLWALASVALVACIAALPVTTSLNAVLYDPSFYEQGQARHAVGRTTEYSLEALRPVNQGIVAFFKAPNVSLPTALADAGADRDVFKEREVGHMEDVRGIVRDVARVQNLAIAVAVAVTAGRFIHAREHATRWIASRVLVGSLATLGAVAAMGLLTFVDFEQLFLQFHLLSFSNDMWMLDPRSDNLIRFFPFAFWFDATVSVAVRSVLSALVIALLALILRRWSPRMTA